MFPWGLEIHGSGFRNPCRQFGSGMRLVRSSYSGTLRACTVDQTFTSVSEARFRDFSLVSIRSESPSAEILLRDRSLHNIQNSEKQKIGFEQSLGFEVRQIQNRIPVLSIIIQKMAGYPCASVSVCQLIIIVSSFCDCWED